MEVVQRLRRIDAAWIFDGCVLLAAVVLAMTMVAMAAQVDPKVPAAAIFATAVVPVLTRFNVSITPVADDLHASFNTAVLIYLALIMDPAWASLLWMCGVFLGIAAISSPWTVRVFEVSVAWLGAVAFTLVAAAIGVVDSTSPRALLAVFAGVCASLLVDLGLSWVRIILVQGRAMRTKVSAAEVAMTFALLFGILGLGFLGVVISSGPAPWTLGLLIIPIVGVVHASRSTVRGRENQRRLEVLLASNRDRHRLTAPEEIIFSAVVHARQLLATDRVEVREEPPGADELGVRLGSDEASSWLVGHARFGRERHRGTDRQALEALVSDTSESLSRGRLIRELTKVARTDALTGLMSRSVFATRVDYAVQEASRGGQFPSVWYLDLDDFKLVNDRFGHDVGDELVRGVGQRLREMSNHTFLTARLGGDEFAILVERVTDRDVTVAHARALDDLLSRPYDINGRTLTVRASIGVAFGAPGIDSDQLLRNADMAMYEAKANPGNGPYVFEPDLRTRILERADMREDLASGIPAGQLRVEYQPVVDLATGHIDGVEALVRWNHPQRGLLGASEFIDIAEESGLIRPLGEWVLSQIATDGPMLIQAAGRPLSMAFNVSARQLADDRVVEAVQDVVAGRNCDLALVLELTESVVIDDDPAVRARLDALVEAGVSLAMDDFGVGYSSIGYLQWLPLSILKLDRSLVNFAVGSRRGYNLLEGIMQMGQALGLRLVAEGVQEQRHVDMLSQLGCHLGQGFLLSPPMPLPDLVALLRTQGPVAPWRAGARDLRLPGPRDSTCLGHSAR